MTFTTKYLKFDFSIANGSFQGGGNSHSAVGLRSGVFISKAGGVSMCSASFAIYGLPLSVMNQLCTFGQTLTLTGKNTVTISAGDNLDSLTTVFVGTISDCFVDGNAQPNVSLRGEAFTGLYDKVKPTQPTSQAGSVDATTLLQKLAQNIGMEFEGNSINAKLRNPYYSNTAVVQIAQICNDIRCEHIIDKGTVAVWPANGCRDGVTEIGPLTGLVGYPSFNSQGLSLRTAFIPSLEYGSKIKVQSSITPACGTWIIHKLDFELESMTPNGKWFALIDAHQPGQSPVA